MNSEKKKVLILSLAYFPKFVGGAEVAIKEITDRLGNKYDFDMVTLRFDRNLPLIEKIGSVNIFRVGYSLPGTTQTHLPLIVKISKILAPVSIFLKALKLCKKNKYDLVWSMMANQAGFAGMFLKFFNKKIPLVLSIQEGDSPESIKRKMRFVLPLYKKIFYSADFVQAISNFLASFSIEMGANSKKIIVVPNGVDVEKFSKISENQQSDIFNELNLGVDDQIIVTASRLVEKNGVEFLIRSLSLLSENIKLLIIGDGPLKNNLNNIVESLELTNRVIFKGYVEPEKIPEYFSISSVFSRPSLSEGLGNVFLEAMASKLPVVATPVGGIVDIIKDGETGLFSKPADYTDLAEKLNLVLSDHDLRKKLAANGFEMVSKGYDWDNIARKMDEIFNSVKVSI